MESEGRRRKSGDTDAHGGRGHKVDAWGVHGCMGVKMGMDDNAWARKGRMGRMERHGDEHGD